jgi:hypothetical protein
MAKMNDVRFMVSSICPADQVAEGDRIYRSHIDWMKGTHHRDGPKALISYDVSKTPELSDPFDLASKPTGNTVFCLTEVYSSDAGVVDHFKQAQESWKDFPAWKAWTGKCKTTKVGAAKVFNTLW